MTVIKGKYRYVSRNGVQKVRTQIQKFKNKKLMKVQSKNVPRYKVTKPGQHREIHREEGRHVNSTTQSLTGRQGCVYTQKHTEG